METALVRPPRASPARPRARRATPVAIALTLVAAAGALMLLQPFGGIHLFPAKATAPRPTTAAAVPAPPAILVEPPVARLTAPPRPVPATNSAETAEPAVAVSGSLQSVGAPQPSAIGAAP